MILHLIISVLLAFFFFSQHDVNFTKWLESLPLSISSVSDVYRNDEGKSQINCIWLLILRLS